MNNDKLSISNILIAISVIFTGLAMYQPAYYNYGVNSMFLAQGDYYIFFLQIFTGQFLHGGIAHLLMNSLFILIFGNTVERILGQKGYILFFLLSSVFIAIGLTISNAGNTIGISGFAMAIMTYFTLYLKQKKDPEYKGGITAIVLNIIIGFAPGISLLGHLFGVISGGLFYMISRQFQKNKTFH